MQLRIVVKKTSVGREILFCKWLIKIHVRTEILALTNKACVVQWLMILKAILCCCFFSCYWNLLEIRIPEVQERVADAVNNIVKHFYRPEKEVRRANFFFVFSQFLLRLCAFVCCCFFTCRFFRFFVSWGSKGEYLCIFKFSR